MAMMISKFNKLIHNKTVWLAFAILISVAFVGVYTGQKASRSGAPDVDPAKEVAGRLWGEDVSRQEFGQAYTGVYVMYSMMMGRPINITSEIDDLINEAAWQRLATLKKAEQMNLTYTKDQVRNLIQRQPLFMNQQTGGFDKNMYEMFVTQFLARNRISQKTFERLMAENVLIEKASAVATQGALVTEEEIKERFHLYSDRITVEYTTLPRSIAGTPDVSEEEAKAYYDKNPEEFRLPEKAIVKYVAFNVADYTNQVSVSEEMISSVYENNKQQFVKPETATNAVPEFQTLDEVRDDIVKRMTDGLANQQAFNAADAMVASLADEVTTFEQAAEKAGRKIISNLPAFAATDRVRGIDPTAPFAQKAFTLDDTPAHYYSDPVRGRDTIYVIALEKKLPAFLPAFDVVKADVTESAKILAAEKTYIDKAAEIHAGVETALKAGITFTDAAGKYNLETTTTAAFSASTPIDDPYAQELMGASLHYDAGTLIDLINTPQDFLMAYVASKEPADETQTLPSMRNEIAESLRQEKTARLTQAWQESLLDEAGFEDLTGETPAEEETTSEP